MFNTPICRCLLAATCVVAIMLPAAAASAQGEFTTFDPPGSVQTVPVSINATGSITSRRTEGINDAFAIHA
jgi:hypothetical protein